MANSSETTRKRLCLSSVLNISTGLALLALIYAASCSLSPTPLRIVILILGFCALAPVYLIVCAIQGIRDNTPLLGVPILGSVAGGVVLIVTLSLLLDSSLSVQKLLQNRSATQEQRGFPQRFEPRQPGNRSIQPPSAPKADNPPLVPPKKFVRPPATPQ